MRVHHYCLMIIASLSALPAGAAPKKHETGSPAASAAQTSPKQIGTYEDWIAATHQEGGQTVCYAFSRAQSSTPKLSDRGAVVLTVTQRSSSRDTVAVEAGFSFAPNAVVTMQVDQTGLEFYTAQRNAFARDGKAAVAAFNKGSRAIARSPGPRDVTVTDTFSLRGFSAAYKAIVKACPAR